MIKADPIRYTYLPLKEDFIYWDDEENDIFIFLMAQAADERELQFDPTSGRISEMIPDS